ncbi:MAG: tetratricopeptide repeat protein [Verrucomicrobia bacterium]|jgi:predicted negative regulator of RcsB-dependent stress response|nr:tetratricopeptide repeat protein [Verrucomicrobiota bacterium]
MTETPKTPEETTPHSDRHDELAEVKRLIETYGKPVVTVLLVFMIAVAGFQLYTSRKQSHAEEAARQLAAATSIPDYEGILDRFGNTDTAPAALLAVAKLYFDNGNYEMALTKYDAFIETYAEDGMVSTAELGRIFCIEARNIGSALQEAAEAYAAFATKYPDSFLMPEAVFGEARCFEQLGAFEEARVLYEDFIADHAENPSRYRAEDLLEQITHRIEMKAQPAAVAAEVSPTKAMPAVVTLPAVEAPEVTEAVEEAPAAVEPK